MSIINFFLFSKLIDIDHIMKLRLASSDFQYKNIHYKINLPLIPNKYIVLSHYKNKTIKN